MRVERLLVSQETLDILGIRSVDDVLKAAEPPPHHVRHYAGFFALHLGLMLRGIHADSMIAAAEQHAMVMESARLGAGE